MIHKKRHSMIIIVTLAFFMLLGYPLGAYKGVAQDDQQEFLPQLKERERQLKLARELAQEESRIKKQQQAEALVKEKKELRKQKLAEDKRAKEELAAKKQALKRQSEEAGEEKLARERERLWQIEEDKRRKEEELEESGAEARLQQEFTAQVKEEERRAEEKKAQELRQQLDAQNEYVRQEAVAKKEEEARRLTDLREEIKVREEKKLWQIKEEKKELDKQLAALALEKQLKSESARKAKEQARIEAQAREEDARRQKELERQRRIEDLSQQKEQEKKRQEELKAESLLKDEVRHRQEIEVKERNYQAESSRRAVMLNRLEAARQEREEAETELKIKREERLRVEALEKLRKEEAQKAKAQVRLKSEEAVRQQKEMELAAAGERGKQEMQEAARYAKAREEERLTKIAEENKVRLKAQEQKKQAELEKKQDELQKKQDELKVQAAAKERRDLDLKAKQEELAQKEKELQLKLKQSALEAVQSKAMSDVMLAKQREDNAKILKIEHLWRQARKLYSQEHYEEASRIFQEIIVLEGNPRVKYTPYAKMYLEKAKEKMEEQKQYAASIDIEHMEHEMTQQVLTKQMPPYLEPPKQIETRATSEEEHLIEMPAIRKKLQKQITLDFDKLDLKTVINFLSQESGVNIIASQKVLELGLKVTARFKDTVAEEAIKYITKSLGLIYRIDKDLIWIAHPEEIAKEPLETRVYYLNKGAGLFTEFSPISSGSSSGDTSLGGSSAQITKIRTLEDTLKDAIPWPTDSKIVYDKRVNALLARNTPQNLQMLEDILYSVDVTPYQILIEARFIEVEVDDSKEFGLEWKLNSDASLGSVKSKGGGAKTVVAKNSGVDFSSFTRAAEGLNFTYQGLLTNPQFQTVLHALSESKKIKTLSSPRITTLNNQMATMKVVDEWIYPTRYEYEIVQVDLNGDGLFTGPGETTYKNVPKDFLRRDVGILLKVVPSMGADKKTISLSLIPEVSEGTADGFTYAGDVTLPKFTSRNLSTTVVVQSGDTVVLGGLIKESTTKTLTKVPVLGDVPLLGVFFRKNADSIVRKNLIIFVTAKLLSPAGDEVVVSPSRTK